MCIRDSAAALDGKKDLFREEKPSVGKCPRCGSPVHEGKKNYYCSNKECAFVMWKNDRFFEERKTAFSAKIAAALLKSGKANVKKLYSCLLYTSANSASVKASTLERVRFASSRISASM